MPSQVAHVLPSCLPFPPQVGQMLSPVPGVPTGASSPGLIGPVLFVVFMLKPFRFEEARRCNAALTPHVGVHRIRTIDAHVRRGLSSLRDRTSCAPSDNVRMYQGRSISANIGGDALPAISQFGGTTRLARPAAGEGQNVTDVRLGVHVPTVGHIEAAPRGFAIGQVLGLVALDGWPQLSEAC